VIDRTIGHFGRLIDRPRHLPGVASPVRRMARQ
jgi:hypothetical protein